MYNTKKTGGGADRFIPNRSTADLELASHSIANNTEEETNSLSSTQIERRRYRLIERELCIKLLNPSIWGKKEGRGEGGIRVGGERVWGISLSRWNVLYKKRYEVT